MTSPAPARRDTHDGESAPRTRRTRAVPVRSGVAVLAGAALLAGCGAPGARAVSEAEAQRLAVMRLADRTDQVAGVRAQVRAGDGMLRVRGWVDWRRSLVYLRYSGVAEGLVQATPRLMAVRAVPLSGDEPPLPPPLDGWEVHRVAGRPLGPIGTVTGMLLSLGADGPDNPVLLRDQGAAWLGHEDLHGTPVDVFRGPAAAGSERTTGTIRYAIDARARLHRLEWDGGRIEFDRRDRARITPVPPL